jgi:hypothetical protein
MIGIQRGPLVGCFRGVLVRMGFLVSLVRLLVRGLRSWTMSVVVPVIEIVGEREGIEPREPPERGGGRCETGTSPGHVRHSFCMIRQRWLFGWDDERSRSSAPIYRRLSYTPSPVE